MAANWSRVVVHALVLFGLLTGAAAAEEAEKPDIIRAIIGGKPTLNMRFRWEAANIDGLKGSNAVTLRTMLGYQTKPYYGFDTYTQFLNILAVDEGAYFDGVPPNTDGRTPVADPEVSEINQGFIRWSSSGLPNGESWFAKSGTSVIGGRQQIVFDDARHIGDVIWRQNQQTYDGGRFTTALGIDKLEGSYAYIAGVKRIFGDNGAAGSPTRDFDSESHFIHVNYSGIDLFKVSAFAYLLDFDNSPANSSDTYGFRATGKLDLGERFFTGYTASYAYQQDAGENPNDYEANYYNVEGVIGLKKWVTLAVGYEVLGSDDGIAQFRTSLSTAHKFNGWADTFLDNGGPVGLEDIYVSLAPNLPWGLKGRLVYHKFDSNDGGLDYGQEIDGIVTKKLWNHVLLLGKFAYYDGEDGGPARADRYRFWIETNITF